MTEIEKKKKTGEQQLGYKWARGGAKTDDRWVQTCNRWVRDGEQMDDRRGT